MSSLGNATTTDAARLGGGLLVPLGATEQHGPHLPLNTDSQIAEAWAHAVADQCPDWIVAPLVPFGSSGEHQSFAGTLSIGGPVLQSLVVELARSARHDFDRVVFLSGHGGNFVPVSAAEKQLKAEGHKVQCFFPHWPNEDSIDGHAGCTETSIMLHLAPEAVRTTQAVKGQTMPVHKLMEAMRSGGVGAVSSSGVLGDPTLATAAVGKRLFEDLVARTVHALG